jgi:hypothetical protein
MNVESIIEEFCFDFSKEEIIDLNSIIEEITELELKKKEDLSNITKLNDKTKRIIKSLIGEIND